MQILPPSACTASVTRRWRATSRGSDNLPAKGLAQAARFGAMPPLTSRPAPPRARAAKYAASFGKSRARSSSPVCIEPMTMRFGRRVKPRSSGANKRPYFMGGECNRHGLAGDLRHELARERVVRRDQQRVLQRFTRAHDITHGRTARGRGTHRLPPRPTLAWIEAPARACSNMTVTARRFLSATAFSSAFLPARSNIASASTSRTRGFFGSSFTASSMREPMRPLAEGDGAHFAAGERAGRGERVRLGALLAVFVGFVEPQRHLGQCVDGLVDFIVALVDGVLCLGLLAWRSAPARGGSA